jgi:hypothetical protein
VVVELAEERGWMVDCRAPASKVGGSQNCSARNPQITKSWEIEDEDEEEEKKKTKKSN